MSVSLDPVVIQKLEQFSRRRTRLILARGLCAGVVSFLLCVAIVGAIDWYWLLSDRVRWALSLGMYVPVLCIVWLTCVRRMIHLPAREEIAAQVELSEPELGENLLSAVELATDDPSAVHDSPVFRGLLQGKVAQQMARVQVPSLLPVRLVSGWLVTACIVLFAACVLLLSGDGRFRQLAVRAILPGANIARVSRVQVEVLQPTPHSLLMAEDETVAVVVNVTGGRFDDVTLETTTSGQGTVRQTMRGRSESEFVASVHVRSESIEYRILAGDAVTERFRIETRPRPRVTEFTKIFHYPDYSLLPEKTVKESHGDLLVLEGTTAELILETDQQVSQAELRIDPVDSDEITVIPLVAEPEGEGLKWRASVPAERASIYKVHLVSRDTGFENLFSPKYEIRPIADLIPRVGFVDQQEATLLLPPDDIVALKAMAEDDLPLVSLEQHVSINGRDWLALPLTTKADESAESSRLTAEWQWDLANHKLRTGDSIITKLVALDRKGNTGESIPLRILIAAVDFDPQRHTRMLRKLELVQPLSDFATLAEEHRKTALETIERLRKPETSPEQATLDRTLLIDMAGKHKDKAASVREMIAEVIKEMPSGAEAHGLELTGRVMARVEKDHSVVPTFLTKVSLLSSDEKQKTTDLEELKRSFERTADDAKNAAEHFRAMAGITFVNALAMDMRAILERQKVVVEGGAQTWDRLLRHETLVLNQIRAMEQLVREQRRRLPSSLDGHMNNLIAWTTSQRDRLQESMESEEKLEQLKSVSAELFRQLKERQRVESVDGSLPGREAGAWRDFDNRAGSLYVPLDQLARAIEQENRLLSQATESADSAAGQNLLNQAARFAADRNLRLSESLEQLRIRRDLTQSRQDADMQFAADAGLTHRAAASLLYIHDLRTHASSTTETEEASEQLNVSTALLEIAPAWRILEAGHELAVARSVLNELINRERWESQGAEAWLEHTRQWDLLSRSFELASQRLREAGVKHEVVSHVDQTRWSVSARDAGRKISERRWKRDFLVGAGNELLKMREDLEAGFELLDPVMAEARAVIAKYSPTIPQMARQTADQLRRLEKSTSAVADALETKSPIDSKDEVNTERAAETTESVTDAEADASEKLAELEKQQEAVNQQIRDLTEALVEDANAQDLMQESERERARDADDSIAMLQEPATQMNEALQKALESATGEQQAQNLAQTAEQQEKTAQVLDLVARHFEQLATGQDVAETRSDLRQAERDLGIARQMDEQYRPAEELSEQASRNTQELLSELETELQQNPAMQQELSEISKNTLQEARNALNYAAQDDKSLQQANERSDAPFQTKKRELAEDLRELAADASRLSTALVAQASQSAAIGKTTEAQKRLTETQQKLNEAASKANAAREDQLLPELAQTAMEARSALAEAGEILQQARVQTQAGKEEQIHADEKTREAQQKEAEKRRQQFHEQQKRAAAEMVKRADDVRKRAEQALQNAEKEQAKAVTRVQQARDKLNAKPEDDGLKRTLQQEEGRLQSEQAKVKQAEELRNELTAKAEEQKKRADSVAARPMPPLDAQNPSTQLADQLTAEALTVAQELSQKAELLVAESDFGKELTPTKNQLAQSQSQQQLVTEDVRKASEEVARAARHERRLNNPSAVEPLQQAAEKIRQVAENESARAEQQLAAAATEAERNEAEAQAAQTQAAQTRDSEAEQDGQSRNSGSSPPNGQALQAQQDIAAAEKAFSMQADQLTAILEPLLASADEAAAANSDSSNPDSSNSDQGDPVPSAPADRGQAQAGQAQAGQAQASQTQAGQSQAGQSAAGENAAAAASSAGSRAPAAEEMARARELAQRLDELDRQIAAAASLAASPSTPDGTDSAGSDPAASRMDTLARAAQAQRAAQAASRRQTQQQLAAALGEGGSFSSDSTSDAVQMTEFSVMPIDRGDNPQWGKLRSRTADDLTQGKSEAVAEEYRRSVETYFRVLSERSRKK